MKLLIVDDDLLIRKSLSLMLANEDDITIVGSASNGQEAFELCQTNTLDAILMDIQMPKVDGIAATKMIKEIHPHVKIMMLTTFDDKANIGQALSAGANGYLLKTDKISDIAGKLRTMMDGVGILDAEVLKKITSSKNPVLDKLTPREQDITKLVAKGLTNKEIGAQLYLSPGTVRNNIAIIMEKLDVKNRTQLGMMYHDG